jgi:pimeloyl-ACP methyl ester carboxylesterase
MVKKHIEYGVFPNRIPYARWGRGEKIMLIFSGGPGNTIPRGMGLHFMTSPFDSFVNEYTIYFLSRKQGQKEDYTTRDMADDYARLIEREFNGSVDVIIGMSYGGLILGHFAADYPDYGNHIILLISAHKVSDMGKEIDYAFARYLSEGKKRKAAVTMMQALYSKGLTRTVICLIMWVIAPLVFKEDHPSYRTDVLIEAEAECTHDSSESLQKIKGPVLLIGGTDDLYFPPSLIEEAAQLIDHATLHLYEGCGHADTMRDNRFARDIRDFITKGDSM